MVGFYRGGVQCGLHTLELADDRGGVHRFTCDATLVLAEHVQCIGK